MRVRGRSEWKKRCGHFLRALREERHMAENTLLSYERDLKKLFAWFRQEGVTSLATVSELRLNSYLLCSSGRAFRRRPLTARRLRSALFLRMRRRAAAISVPRRRDCAACGRNTGIRIFSRRRRFRAFSARPRGAAQSSSATARCSGFSARGTPGLRAHLAEDRRCGCTARLCAAAVERTGARGLV